ncbi:transmembrane anchor protein [bacterium]|nr:MAG: transmembrane anchor protein [bacterium]
MHNANIPDHAELPTTAKLIKSTIIAIIAAAVILITLVLPAEFGIDPTGIGQLTGLQRMGEIKTSLANELEEQTTESEPTFPAPTGITTDIPQLDPASPRTDELSVTLDPDKSTEIKITMTKGTAVDFTWSTNGAQAFYDLHADSKEVNYHIYEKGTAQTKSGTLTAAFTGNHGWYWKNRTNSPITITLKATGHYQDIKEMN